MCGASRASDRRSMGSLPHGHTAQLCGHWLQAEINELYTVSEDNTVYVCKEPGCNTLGSNP